MMEMKRVQQIVIKYLQWGKHTEKNPLFDYHSQHMQNIWQLTLPFVFQDWGYLLKGGALSVVEDVVDWSVGHCNFSVMHDYAMFLEYSCFKNYYYSAQHAYDCTLHSASICSLLFLPCPKGGAVSIWGLLMGWVTLSASGKLVLWLRYGQTWFRPMN